MVGTLRPQRLLASPSTITSTVVSVSGLSPAQLQAATQRLIVTAATGSQGKGVATAGVQGKTISPAQLAMIRQSAMKQQLRVHAGNLTTQVSRVQ